MKERRDRKGVAKVIILRASQTTAEETLNVPRTSLSPCPFFKPSAFLVSPVEQPPIITKEDVRRRFKLHKAVGQDNILGHVLKGCTHQLSELWTNIFNFLLSQLKSSACFKSATIIPDLSSVVSE